jgi:CSLREA domain-containing protein
MKPGIIHTLLLALLIAMIACATLSGANADSARATAQSNPLINFQELNLAGSLNSGGATALALASGDFDEDGMDDLLAAYSTGEGGKIIFYRADQDAIFQSETLSLVLMEAPELMATGDFDADGNLDLVAARRAGNTLHLFRGNGRGRFAEAEAVSLPGRVVAMAAGEVNRRDGLGDLIVSIASDEGARVLVFESPEGALRSKPEILPLPAEAGSIALANLDNDFNVDIALALGSEVAIAHGRDRKLTLAEYARTDVMPARMERLNAGALISSIATGDFTGDSRDDIAIVTDEGTIRFLERTDAQQGQPEARAGNGQISMARKVRKERREASWALSSSGISLHGRGNNSSPAAMLVAAKVSALAKTDLLIADSRLHIFNHASQDAESIASYDMAGEVVAVLPMRLNQDALSDLVILNRNSLAPSLLVTAPNATFTVNSTADTDDGACNANCTLREAIKAANNTPGADTIQFALGAGTPTINVGSTGLSDLPRITDAVTINGNTGGATRVELNGASASFNGIYLQTSNATVRGLVINRFPFDGVSIEGNNNLVANCLIGTDSGGTLDLGNGNYGVVIYDESNNNRIGGTTPADKNVISGNGRYGINIGVFSFTAMSGNILGRNFVGVNITGDAAIPNDDGGIFLDLSAEGNTIGVGPGGFNVVSGNLGAGITIDGDSNLVQFNLVGTNIIGDQRVPNFTDGILCFRDNNTIGGPADTAINLVSGNTNSGIHIRNGSGNKIQGCKIGTNVDGNAILFNAGNGILLDGGISTRDNEIGGITTQLRNLISGNRSAGIRLAQRDADNNRIFGNYIGTDVTGDAALPNSNHGILIESGPESNIIGGLTAAERNVISGNFEAGVRVFNGVSNEVVRVNKVIGNYIGVNASGAALGNSAHGVWLSETTTAHRPHLLCTPAPLLPCSPAPLLLLCLCGMYF